MKLSLAPQRQNKSLIACHSFCTIHRWLFVLIKILWEKKKTEIEKEGEFAAIGKQALKLSISIIQFINKKVNLFFIYMYSYLSVIHDDVDTHTKKNVTYLVNK